MMKQRGQLKDYRGKWQVTGEKIELGKPSFVLGKNPIKWCEMANNDVQHDVKFIFMLGFLGGHDDPNAGNEHVELLQVLVTNFQKPEVMDKLVNAKTEDEYMEAVLSMEGL